MKTLKETFKEIAFNNIEGLTVDEAVNFLTNEAIPVTGAVTGLIYYRETEEIAQNHYSELIEYYNEYRYNGNCKDIGDFETLGQLYNWLVWYVWELFVADSNFIDEVIEEALETGIIEDEE